MLLKRAKEVADECNKKVVSVVVIQSEGIDFKAFYDAKYKLEKHGYSLNRMIKNNPVEFHRNNKLSGIILTDSTYKNGSVAIVYFK